MYMSYCRFEGTLAEMRACMQDVEDHANGEAGEAVSDREIRSFRNMVDEFVGFLRDMAILDDAKQMALNILRNTESAKRHY